jgi:hypothetical protein
MKYLQGLVVDASAAENPGMQSPSKYVSVFGLALALPPEPSLPEPEPAVGPEPAPEPGVLSESTWPPQAVAAKAHQMAKTRSNPGMLDEGM